MKQVTIQDIARIAGVSKSTVSRVLNGTAVVNPEKQKAVMRAADRLGFQPNVVAQSLASGQSMTIGVLTQLIGSPFFDTIAQGVIRGLGGSRYCPIFVDGQWETNAEIESIRALLGRRVDGLVLIGGSVPGDEIAELVGSVPTVVVARQLAGDQHYCVFMDNVDGGYQATKHLIEHGHRQIVFIGGLQQHTDATDRFTGYKQALLEAGIDLDPNLVLDGDFSAETANRLTTELLNKKHPFTAIFTANDMTAFGAHLALHRHGLKVPDDVSLVGFDDQMEAAFMTPPLTTVRQPALEMGEQASKTLVKLIRGEEIQSEEVRPKLIVRESVAKISV